MEPLNAVVKNGRLTLDVPSALPEGQIVVLLPLEELLAEADAFAAEPPPPAKRGGRGADSHVRFELVAPPPRAFKKAKAVDAAALIAELRSL